MPVITTLVLVVFSNIFVGNFWPARVQSWDFRPALQEISLKRVFLSLSFCCVALGGCSNDGGFMGTSFSVTGASLAGKLLSGTRPVSGAHVYLMAVATTGYGKPSVSLLDSGSTGSQDSVGAYVVTGTDGSFTIPGFYSCSAQTDLYVYTSGGDSGLGQNSAATELAAIGPCPQVGAVVPPVVVNEVTTVAMSFALAGFANDALHVASSGTSLALTGVANAFLNASHLGPTATGIAPALLPSGNATVPQTTINTLANILSSCIHSAGAGSAACGALFGNAGSAPHASDTASAMIAIAHSPASAVPALFALQSSTLPFAPYLTVAPSDFNLGLVFTEGGIGLIGGMAVDAMGDLWSTNITSYYVTEISSAGTFLSGPSGYFSGAYAAGPIAVDTNDNIWIGGGAHTFGGPGEIFELSSSGAILSGMNGYTGYGIETPEGLAIDANSNIWIADRANDNIVELSSAGQVLSGTKGFTSGGISGPQQLAINPSGEVWIANFTSSTTTELSNSGAPLTPSTGIAVPAASLAIDHQGNVWGAAAGVTYADVSKVSPSGAILSGTGYTGGGIGGTNDGGAFIAIDGDGNAWIPLYNHPSIVELSNSGAPLSGADGYATLSDANEYATGIAESPANIVVDGSGDVWVSSARLIPSTQRGVPATYTYTITEMIGVAAPVVTPIAAGVQRNMLGARP
jgi:hypothetical protein